MKTLEECRTEIDALDEELVQLFEKRFHVIKDVVIYKQANNLPVFDVSREEEITQRNKDFLEDKELEKYFVQWYQELLKISKQYQDDILQG